MDKDLLRNWKEWIELLFPLLIFLGLYLYRHIRQFAKGKRLKEVAPFVNGEVVIRPLSSPRIQGNYMGVPFRMSFLPSGRNTPGRMQIHLNFPSGFVLEVIPKGQRSGLEEVFGKGKNITTGEDVFNDAVAARVEKEREKAMLYLDNPFNRTVILDLFKIGFQSVRFSEKGVVLTKQGDFLGTDGITPEQALEYLTLAGKLVQRV